MPLVLELAEATARRAAPGAWIVDFTNPVGIVTQALLDDGHRAVGLCNVAINLQRRFAKRFGVEPDRVELEHVGLNHLTLGARGPGGRRRSAARAARRRSRRGSRDHVGLPVELVSALGPIPSYYLRYYYETAAWSSRSSAIGHTRAQRRHGDRGDSCSSCTGTRAWPRSRRCSSDRGGAYYSEAAAQLIASLHDGAGDIQVVDVRNDGALPDLPDSAVVEVPGRVDRDGAHPLPRRRSPRRCAAWSRRRRPTRNWRSRPRSAATGGRRCAR